LPTRLGFAAWEAILVGVAKNLETVKRLSNPELSQRIVRLIGGPELSPDALRGALSGTEKVKGRIGAGVRAFA